MSFMMPEMPEPAPPPPAPPPMAPPAQPGGPKKPKPKMRQPGFFGTGGEIGGAGAVGSYAGKTLLGQ